MLKFWWFQIYFVPLHRHSDKAFFEILKQTIGNIATKQFNL